MGATIRGSFAFFGVLRLWKYDTLKQGKSQKQKVKRQKAGLNKLKEQLEHAKNNKTEQIDIFLMRMIASDEDTIFDD